MALLATVAGVAGCATIPTSSEPEAVGTRDPGRRVRPPLAPEPGSDPLTLVRRYIEASGNPDGKHAAGRAYLTQNAQPNWRDDSSMHIIGNDFSTFPAESEDSRGDDKATVLVRGKWKGRLGRDNAFIPDSNDFEKRIRLEKEKGEWRIADPPDGVVTTIDRFDENYKPVPVYFLDRKRGEPVPDLRYIPSQPRSAQPNAVIEMLLKGPSPALKDAVRSAIPEGVRLRGNVVDAPDGALVVNLTDVGEQTSQNVRLIATQVVLSLNSVSSLKVKLLSENVPIDKNKVDWRPSDFPQTTGDNVPPPNVPGMVVLGGRLRTLEKGGGPVKGPAGSLDVVTAAQSIDGGRLAVVTRSGSGQVALRVGPVEGNLTEVNLDPASHLTRPTWQPASNDRGATELWTTVDHKSVVSVVYNTDREWTTRNVDATELTRNGSITDLRLSRDGVRVAAVVDSKLFVGSVVDNGNDVSIRNVRKLMDGVTAVDWQGPDNLIVGSDNAGQPVIKVSVDGLTVKPYTATNLSPPVTAVTAAPGRQVVVADSRGLWVTADDSEYWREHPANMMKQPNAVPFYPG
ncbi:lipoprotein [Longimycelium tulufanense]|uniref:Lipoprotein n=1 Tax=Longimycelium tulufanense TaxID=907463 RepID=A0A8J3FYY6_9PSEU|nr:lipoprotein [Longimycelium tulufanense]